MAIPGHDPFEGPNPYAPPTAPLEPGADVAARPLDASKGQRFANYLVDTVVLSVVQLLLPATRPPEGAPTAGLLGALVLSLFINVAYHLALEYSGGRTIGKLVTGTRVVSESGGRPSFGQVLGRSLMRLVPLEPFSFLGPGPRGWHDTVTHTRVVRVERAAR